MATVVLTRPQGKNQALATALQAQGVITITLPALCIKPTIAKLPAAYLPTDFDLLVFVSAHAAQYYLAALKAAGQGLASGQRIATVGAASAQPFYEAGLASQVQLIHPPASDPLQDSEALWQLLQPQLVDFNQVLLVRGQQGREWLSERLLEAKKHVVRCSIYERLPAVWSSTDVQIIALAQALTHPKNVTMLLSSSESTQAIYTNIKRLGLIPAWQQMNFVAIHPRIAQCLQEISALSNPEISSQLTLCAPSQSAMLEALLSVAMPTHA